MDKNNSVKLIGNMGSEARTTEKDGKLMAAFSLATTDSYIDDKGEWQKKQTVWHNVLVFNKAAIAIVESFKKGARIEVEGSISYRPFEIQLEEGKTITKQEASIIADLIKPAALYKKSNQSEQSTPQPQNA